MSVAEIIEKLKDFENKIVYAADLKSEAQAIHSLKLWYDKYREAHFNRDRGDDLVVGMTVTEKSSGKNITNNIWVSQGPVVMEIEFWKDAGTESKKIYVMRFVPKEKKNLETLFLE